MAFATVVDRGNGSLLASRHGSSQPRSAAMKTLNATPSSVTFGVGLIPT
jgi:uncharacterized membrane protein